MSLTWGCRKSRGEKKSEPFPWLIHQRVFSVHFLLLPSEYSILLYQPKLGYLQAQCDNKSLVHKSVHFRLLGMKAFMDQTYILSLKDIYFQKPVSETITSCKSHSFSYF